MRLSDFKSNEYAHLIGGAEFEPAEENPMLGLRGASRYYSERYREGFALECRAIHKLREELGFGNVIVMVPFCRSAVLPFCRSAVLPLAGGSRPRAGAHGGTRDRAWSQRS